MYRNFELLPEDHSRFFGFEEFGRQYFDMQDKAVRKSIGEYVKNGVMDGNDVIGDWFGEVEANVFISHSHADRSLAVSVAGWLHWKMGLRPFVDSCVWGHADCLLKEIDKDHCWNEGRGYYEYVARNRSTSHVHMMLSTALTQMIDQTECIIFLNTPQSFKSDGLKSGNLARLSNERETGSPWIYAEIVATQCLRENVPERRRRFITEDHALRKAEASLESLKVSYRARTDHLIPLDDARLTRWEETATRGTRALDTLYEMYPRRR